MFNKMILEVEVENSELDKNALVMEEIRRYLDKYEIEDFASNEVFLNKLLEEIEDILYDVY